MEKMHYSDKNLSGKSFSDGYHSMEEMVRDIFGGETRLERMDSVYGGDINDAYRVNLSNGEHIFVKTNSIRNRAFFRTEARGLSALGASGKIGVPKILGTGTDEGRGVSFLALEYIDSAPRIDTYWETFGHELAELHRAECLPFVASEEKRGKCDLRYGFAEDNFIGATPQKNSPKEKWTDFYRESRLLPQLERAEHYLGAELMKRADSLLEHLDSYLREPEFPSLLHGDLWSGNMMCGPDGKAWIIDPAVYVGDFETDLAMTQLFGSLPERFYAAYGEVNPIDRKGYAERKKLYDLYHLLNHLNLFGRSYFSSVAEIIREYT